MTTGQIEKPITVGISISEPDPDELARLGYGLLHVQDAIVETARHLLSKGYNLAYGGDLNYSGAFNFTELLFQLGMTYGGIGQRITNYAAFPLYTRISRTREAEISRTARIERINPKQIPERWLKVRYEEASPEDRQFLDQVFKAEGDQSRAIWAESLTAMRRRMTEAIDCRIVIGGKTRDYKGSMPGILEETILCVEQHKTVFVDGRFGGAALEIIDVLRYGLKEKLLSTPLVMLEKPKKTFLDPQLIQLGDEYFPEVSNAIRML